MMEPMGKSGRFAVTAGIVAAGLLVLTGMTLAEPVFVAFLGVLLLACLACLMEILNRGRRAALLAAGAGTSLTLGFSLAFVSTWELAFAGESSFIGTPLPTGDPDNYFFGAAAAGLGTLSVLFLGAAWPHGRRLRPRAGASTVKRRSTAARRPAAPGAGRGRAPQRATHQQAPSQRTQAKKPSGDGKGGVRTPARVPSAAARRPSSSASQARTAAQAKQAAQKPGSRSTPRR